MKRNTVLSMGTLSILIGMLMLGCAEKPMTTLDAADMALKEARQAGAPDYAPESFREAETAYQMAQEELAIQDSKFAIMRNYESVEGMLQAVNQEALRAKTEAVANKERVKSEAQSAMTNAKSRVQEARVILAKAPMGKGSQADLQALNGDLQTAESMLVEVDGALVAEDFLGAKAKAQAIESLAIRVHDEVAHALQKTGKAKA
ncbi:hypothetical protein [Candidatus Nitronereus thalassa]|uniref:DUF4398 domain-containing protein n=1 Tax=Candidatus Nitronereus thalassa TaxID=3020898 RepID=A0ABU3K5V5_9BACT|nr:hypothetical protein [Candidatus Nitronereus thalassa]MDT7041735.1 hypothetical protein [Candidatus Nitronereus thalassa]